MLNALWFGFFIVALLSGFYQWIWLGQSDIFATMVQSLFDMAKLSVELMLVLFGTLTLWMGFLQIAERAGLIDKLGYLLAPLFQRLMPDVPRGHPALGLITLNFAANGLGLDNAATPIGLRAMRELQSLNPSPNTATNAQILFLVLNASSLTLLPITIFMYRAQQGAADPTLVFLPILLATTASSLAGLLSVAWIQRLRLYDPVVLLWLVPFIVALGLFMAVLATLSATALTALSSLMGNLVLLLVILGFLLAAVWKKIPVYDAFIEGAKGGFEVSKQLLPYLVAMLCAIGLLRASGALDAVLAAIRWAATALSLDTQFVDALPTALAKPFSGGAARGLMIETMQHYGPDSFPALVAATVQGSTETTFYVLAVYFGSVGVTRTRYTVGCALLSDVVGVVTAILVCYWFFT
ncbi:MAG TPA: spore maturation protein [Candidatus Paenalcaligenes intestinipullorum]|uniref:Spore maturation protein n=1 Tax=Candidatus Paenalcaligenes intestinipullorum TaxID=2838718 RepID=A0A9D2U9S4_9BURK|nr:spore maturation protein [Candidatus Paenalcaligenes intestinipullorum]